MRALFLIVFCVFLASCVKTDFEPLPRITKVDVNEFSHKDLSDAANVAAVVDFINGQRFGWTRPFVFGFGAPDPFLHIGLYDGDILVGEFTVRSGVLPGGHALFELRCRNNRGYKRVAKSEANRLLATLGISGGLTESTSTELRQQIAHQSPTSGAVSLKDRPVKFQPGDRVRVKATRAEGTVCLRTRFFSEDLYLITFPESENVWLPIQERLREQEERARWHAQSVAELGYDFPESQPRPSHEQGPFYESDLELIP